MIREQKVLKLFGHKVFELLQVEPPFRKSNAMSKEACFLHIIEGSGVTLSETESIDFQSNDTILMKCGNYLTKVKKGNNQQSFSYFAVHFHIDVLRHVYQHEVPDFIYRKSQKNTPTALKLANNFFVEKYIAGMKTYFEHPEAVPEDLLVIKLKEIILLLSQTEEYHSIKAILSALFSPRVFKLKQVVEAHLYDDLKVEELAVLCNRSLSTFKRDFKAVYHESPASYIRNKKLERAKDLILHTDQRISELALECGFNNLQHFTKAFQKKYNYKPSRLRVDEKHN